MPAAPIPECEAQRLERLRSLDILDTPPEDTFARITGLAARLFDAPIAVVSLVDAEREWFKSCRGVEVSQADRSIAFCAYAILNDDLLVVEDAAADVRFSDNPQVTRDGIRFYAGAPLHTSDGYNVGALCVKDYRPRSFSALQRETLSDLAAVVTREMEVRIAAQQLDRARSELNETERRFRELANAAPIIIWLSGTNRKCTYLNQAWIRFTGNPVEADLEDGWTNVVHPGDRDATMRAYTQAFDARQTFEIEFRLRREDGAYRWMLSRGAPRFRDDGTFTGYVGTCLDITERHMAETELRRAKEQAVAANSAKSEFLANMSHEIRTPMTAVLGYIDLLSDPECAADERTKYLQRVRHNAEHLLSVINDILDLSKIEAERMTIERIACSPCAITAEALSVMRVHADAKGLSLDVQFESAIPDVVLGDPLRLRQILLNLLGNAVKFTEVGGVQLIARFRHAPCPTLEFDVVDTGVGMSPGDAERIFDPFSQADGTTARRFGGTGLGLTICKRLAKLMDGDVCLIESSPGAGTRFRASVAVALPPHARPLDNPTAATVVIPEMNTNPPVAADALSNRRILLVEDGPDNQRLIAHFLRRAGASVTIASDGREGVQRALESRERAAPFDVILMDMQMPVMDGYTAARALRSADWKGPIIALTAHAMREDRDKCLKAGCDDYAAKPIDRTRLIDLIRARVSSCAAT